MRVLLQRVTHGQVQVDAQAVGAVSQGLVILLGVGQGDTAADADKLAEKVANLRIFSDAQGKFKLSLLDVAGGALVVSQFTLYADARKGRCPSFTDAAPPDLAKNLCDHFARKLRDLGVKQVETGIFAAHMLVTIHNDGPVTLWLDSREM
ncbi:MAG: D-tyrosyl-tRNA(Tyr) deacylase [Phycisphaeraceae bacterium]|nr:D-tyrosyl-tRNA(Tyr) deacylase [Phycisphaeraceae bacterium]